MQYLSKYPYDEIDPEDLKAAKKLLDEEIDVVKSAMQHGNLSIDVYSKVWRDCYSQVRRFIVSMTDACDQNSIRNARK